MTPTPHNDDSHPFIPYLQPGEELLWVGRPNAEVYAVRRRRRSIRIFIWLTAFSVINTVFVALVASTHPLPYLIECSLFITLFSAGYLVFLLRSSPRPSTYHCPWYAVSNKHVMEHTGFGEDPFHAIPFERVQGLMVTAASDNVGSVNFVKGTVLTHLMCLTDIDEAWEVCEQIQAAAGRDIPIVEKA